MLYFVFQCVASAEGTHIFECLKIKSQVPLRYYKIFNLCYDLFREPGSSVRIVSDYGLDDRTIEVRSPAEVKDFFSTLCVQTGSESHSVSYPMGTGGKARPGCDADHSTLFSAEVVNE
jgi:hypothetical protein